MTYTCKALFYHPLRSKVLLSQSGPVIDYQVTMYPRQFSAPESYVHKIMSTTFDFCHM